MGDHHHQVKTSFLFIQLQSPSKAHGRPRTAVSTSLATRVEGASSAGATVTASEPVTPEEAGDCKVTAVRVEVNEDEESELGGEALVLSSESESEDVSLVSGGCRRLEGSCVKTEEPLKGLQEGIREASDKPVWVLREDSLTAMDKENQEPESGTVNPASPSQIHSGAPRTSFLHLTGGPDTLLKASEEKRGEPSKPVHQGPAQSNMSPRNQRSSTHNWVTSAKQKEHAKASPQTSPEVAPKSPLCKTFLFAVKERSSKLSGDPYKKASTGSLPECLPTSQTGVKAPSPTPPVSLDTVSSDVSQAPAQTVAPSPELGSGPLTIVEAVETQKAEAFVWVNNSSSHAQSVAKAKYEFLFGKAEESSSSSDSGSSVNSQVLLEAESTSSAGESTNVASCLPDDDNDDFVFLEIDRELASLLSGLHARAQDATVASQEGPEDSHQPAHSQSSAAMIPCNAQNGSSPETADQASDRQAGGLGVGDEENGILDLVGLDSPGDLHLSPTYLLDSWTEALLKDTVFPSTAAAAEKLAGVPEAVANGDIRNAAADGQEKPDSTTTTSSLHLPPQVAAFPSVAAPAASHMEPSLNNTLGMEEAPASDADVGTVLLNDAPPSDGSLEESSKILAEIPGILTAFLDGGMPREKPSKKLRFDESGQPPMADGGASEEPEGGSRGSRSSLKVESAADRLSPLERLCPLPLEDEVFRSLPEASPDVQEPSSDSTTTQTNGSEEADGGEVSESPEATDVFSSQFESILESERLRSTLYSSLDSLDALSSSADDETDTGLTLDMPLTPMIQQRLKETGHFLDLTPDGGRQEVLSVTATGKSGKAALEVTSSYLDVASGSSGFGSQLDGHSDIALANGVSENLEQEPKDWLHGCLSSRPTLSRCWLSIRSKS